MFTNFHLGNAKSICYFSTNKVLQPYPELNVQKKEEEKGFMEFNKTMTLDESEENVYRSTLMFCETLKSFKAVDLKETSMESLLWASYNRQHLLKPVISAEVLEHLTVLGNNASRLNMVIVDTPEDGDCLLYSVAYGLQKYFMIFQNV